jgi:hypothetical protein
MDLNGSLLVDIAMRGVLVKQLPCPGGVIANISRSVLVALVASVVAEVPVLICH